MRPFALLLLVAASLPAACGSDPAMNDPPDAASTARADAAVAGADAAGSALGDAGPPAADAGAGSRDAGARRDAATSAPDASTAGRDASTGGADAAAPAPWTFVVMGDNQFATTSCTSGVTERLAVPKAISATNPAFIVHVGDLMDHGYETGAYAQFKSCYATMLADAPFFPVAGNHDLGSGAAVKFRDYLEEALQTTNPGVYGAGWTKDFKVVYGDDPTSYSTNPSAPANRPDLPSGFSFKTFYAFKFRNAYFVGLEAGTQWWTNTPRSWIAKHLAAAKADPSVEHVFVWLHHPLYSSTMPDDDPAQDSLLFVRNAYEPTFRQHGVTAVFSGHVHLYDRFYVPDDGHATRSATPPATYARSDSAIHHLTLGGAGGPLPSGCSPIPAEKNLTSHAFQQKRQCGYHFLKVKVEGTKLTFDVIGVDGSSTSYTTAAWDHFTVQ